MLAHEAAPTPAADYASLRESGNAAYRDGEYRKAIEWYTDALHATSVGDERASVLTNRSNANFALDNFKASRADALEALKASTYHVKALFRLAMAEERLGNIPAAIAALAAGACHAEPTSAHFDTFTQYARKLGAWRLPPPLLGVHPEQKDEPVATIGPNASRAEFMAFAEKGLPVIVKGFADVSRWSWSGLVDIARAAEQAGRGISGDVLVSASGCVPDYCRGPAEPHCSRVETMAIKRIGLRELFERVSRGVTADDRPLVARYEKIYSYGKGWMLADEEVRRKARAAWPTFMEEADLVADESGHGSISGGGREHLTTSGTSTELSSSVCWVGTAGCLTPLHYDCSDGLLAQVLGEKRVWLFPPEDMDHCYLRSSARPGIDNWARQSQASLHGAPAGDWPLLKKARRIVADLRPGDCLYIPSDWLHEVHSRTASFSLGWRIAMVKSGPGGGRTERTASQKIERMASAVKSGKMSIAESLSEALSDPSMLAMMNQMMGADGGASAMAKMMAGGGGGAAPAGGLGLGNLDPTAILGGMDPAALTQMMGGMDPSMLMGMMGGQGAAAGGGAGRRS